MAYHFKVFINNKFDFLTHVFLGKMIQVLKLYYKESFIKNNLCNTEY